MSEPRKSEEGGGEPALAGAPAWLKIALVGVPLAAAAAWFSWDLALRDVWDRVVVEPRRAEAALEVERADAPAPPFALAGLDGRKVALADLRGQVVFVNFWATWCPPCREEMPTMLRLGAELEAAHPGKFKMVAVSVDDGWEPVRSFFPGGLVRGAAVLLDEDQATTKAYYCAARGGCPQDFKFPESYVVDRAGRLVGYFVGPRDWSDPAARRYLEKLIDR